MKKQLLAVKDIVLITGITTRTLHYYDKINLFKPTQLTENGYQLYDQRAGPIGLSAAAMLMLVIQMMTRSNKYK